MLFQQFHLRKARALRVGFPFSSRIAPCIPPILAQKDLRRFADLDPAFSFEGGVVTAIFNLLPGFSARYEATPFLLRPPSGFFPALRVHAAVSLTGTQLGTWRLPLRFVPIARYPFQHDSVNALKDFINSMYSVTNANE